jgi:PAS domain-containing protein
VDSIRRTASDRVVEFNFKPLPDGGLLGIYRDITELKEREEAIAASKEAAEASRADLERTSSVLQTVLDNMSDGVTLWDKNFRWQFSNRFNMQMWSYKPEMLQPGVSGFDMIRDKTPDDGPTRMTSEATHSPRGRRSTICANPGALASPHRCSGA